MMNSISARTLGWVLLILVPLFGIHSCTDDYFDLDRLEDDPFVWNPDLAFPLVFSSLSVADIIAEDEQNYYQIDDDDFVTLIFTRTVLSETLNEFLRLESPQGLQTPISLNASEIVDFTTDGQVSKTVLPSFVLSIENVNGAVLNTAILESGTMTIAFTSDFQHSGTLVVSMPEMRLNGTPYSQAFPINYTGSTVNQSFDIDLAGYEMTLNTGNNAQEIPITYTLQLLNGGGTPPQPLNSVSVSHSFNTLEMAFADGYFGQFDIEVPSGRIGLDLLENGALYFEDPRLKLRVMNEIGASLSISVDELYAEGDGISIPFNYSSVMSSPFTIAAAPTPGDSAVQEFYFTRSNSNISQLANEEFDNFHHDFSATLNPGGQTYNFANRNSAVVVTADVELPFWGKSDHYIFEDTLDNPMSEIGDIKDNIEEGLLRINTLNGFPLDGILKLYLMDSLYNTVDSLLANGEYVIVSGPVDGNGKVISAVNQNNDIPIDSTRVNTLFGAKYLRVHADLTSTDDADKNIRIYSDDLLQVRIGLQVKLSASPSDLGDL